MLFTSKFNKKQDRLILQAITNRKNSMKDAISKVIDKINYLSENSTKFTVQQCINRYRTIRTN